MHESYIIQNAKVYGTGTASPAQSDIYIRNGLFTAEKPDQEDTKIIDASGLIAAPGFIDLHVHFREPGHTEAETIATGSAAAAAGGFSSVVTMPNTLPATDSAEMISMMQEKADSAGLVKVLPCGCISKERKGLELADLESMKAAGAVAFSDDGNTVVDMDLMVRAAAESARLGCPIMDHALDPELAGNGAIRQGKSSEALNIPGIPEEAEIKIVERDIRIAEETGCTMHIQHISSGRSVELIRKAIARGLPVTGEASPHHMALSDSMITSDDANFKMNPPLGTEKDMRELAEGVADGTLKSIATDHAPHTAEKKRLGLEKAPFGIIGLETAIGATYTQLVRSGLIDIPTWIERWTKGPAEILNIEPPSIEPGKPADLVLIDIEREWTVNPAEFKSMSRNTPFTDRVLTGRPVLTFCSGRCTYDLSGEQE